VATRVIAGKLFDGPWPLTFAPGLLRHRSGVYIIAEKWGMKVLDTDESDNVGAHIANHERRTCWTKYAPESDLVVYILESDTPGQRFQDGVEVREQLPPRLACYPK
jgi:hypothetical protein